jgi:hypothetical protein
MCDGGEPRAHRLSADRHVEIGWFDGVHVPPVRERVPDLVLGDATRTPSRRFVLAEAQHEVLTARSDHARKTRDEGRTIRVVEHMEQPAIKDHVELFTERREVARITHDETRRYTALARLRSGEADRGRGDVDTDRFATCIGRHQDVLSRSTTNIEHTPPEATLGCERRECRLRFSDVPRGRHCVRGLELGHEISSRLLFCHGRSLLLIAAPSREAQNARTAPGLPAMPPVQIAVARDQQIWAAAGLELRWKNHAMREADRPIGERVSVLDRQPADGDLPPIVSGLLDDRVDRSSVRLALVDDDRRVFIGRGAGDELSVLFVDAQGGGACTGPRSTLAERGAIVMWTSGWGGAQGRPDKSRLVVTGVVADFVTAVRVGDVSAALQNNAFAAAMPRGASDVVIVSTPDGERQVPLPRLDI